MVEFATAFPAHGQVMSSNELRKLSIFMSPSRVRSIWLRHNLSSMKHRLSALEKMSAEQGIILTETQVQALERKKQDDEACGEIESHHPGYLGSLDTFYVGTIKGLATFTSKPLWILTRSGPQPSSLPPRRSLPARIY